MKIFIIYYYTLLVIYIIYMCDNITETLLYLIIKLSELTIHD